MGLENYKPMIVMVGCQLLYSGLTLSCRAVLLDNMSSRVFVVYRQCFAFLLLAPFVFFSRTGRKECCLGWKSFWMISLVAFTGVTVNQNIYLEGLYLSSSSAASAMANLVPAITFILAYTLGLEKVNLRSIRSLSKIVGTVLCVSGAAAMALLKGPKLLNMELFQLKNLFTGQDNTWLLGCIFLFASTICWSLWLILQVKVSRYHPDHVTMTAWMCVMAAVQSGMVTVLVEPDLNAWRLTSPLQLFSCLFAGFTSATTFFGQAWCIARRGPLFSALFQPLCTVIVTLFACLFMREELYTGSLMGGLIVIIGLYIVLWGKSNDHQEMRHDEDTVQHKSDQVSDSISNCTIDLEKPLLSGKV